MPELPEVQTVASELNRKLKNRTLRSVIINAPKMVAIGPDTVANRRQVSSFKVIKFIKLLQGQKIVSVKRRAKLLIFDLSGPWTLLVHLKMTGQFIFEDEKLRSRTHSKYRIINKLAAPLVSMPCKHTHVIFEFADASKLYFNDIRKFGYLKLVRDDELNQVKELQEFGPEPLDRKFTPFLFFTAVKNRNDSKIKEVLIDQRIVAGIGNIYSDEILFHARIRPTRRISSLSSSELKKVYNAIRKVLLKAIAVKGSSVGDFVRTDGSWGHMGKYHYVYGRKGQKCKKCGSVIMSVKMHGRLGSYCPKCQK